VHGSLPPSLRRSSTRAETRRRLTPPCLPVQSGHSPSGRPARQPPDRRSPRCRCRHRCHRRCSRVRTPSLRPQQRGPTRSPAFPSPHNRATRAEGGSAPIGSDPGSLHATSRTRAGLIRPGRAGQPVWRRPADGQRRGVAARDTRGGGMLIGVSPRGWSVLRWGSHAAAAVTFAVAGVRMFRDGNLEFDLWWAAFFVVWSLWPLSGFRGAAGGAECADQSDPGAAGSP